MNKQTARPIQTLSVSRTNPFSAISLSFLFFTVNSLFMPLLSERMRRFHPQMVYFANLCVNLRDHLCDVARHVSA